MILLSFTSINTIKLLRKDFISPSISKKVESFLRVDRANMCQLGMDHLRTMFWVSSSNLADLLSLAINLGLMVLPSPMFSVA